MLQTLKNAWKTKDIKSKIIFTLFILVLYRIGSVIPVPFVNLTGNEFSSNEFAGTFIQYLSIMTGEAFTYGTIFAMSITPYINSSIIMQLLTVAIPALERLSKEGEEGRKKIATITRYVTVLLAIMQSTAYFLVKRKLLNPLLGSFL